MRNARRFVWYFTVTEVENMEKQYNSVEEYVKDIYDNLYPRAKAAADLLMNKGIITKYDFESTNVPISQAPRAIRDLKDHGIPIKTLERVNVPQSKSKVSQYTFGDVADITVANKYGRMYNPTGMKDRLAKLHGNVCVFCGKELSGKDRELDHKLPVNIFGDLSPVERLNPDNYQLVCRKCNRLKREATSHGAFDDRQDGMEVVEHNYWYDPVQYRKNKSDSLFAQSIVIWNTNNDLRLYKEVSQYAKESNKSFQNSLKDIVKIGLEAMKVK